MPSVEARLARLLEKGSIGPYSSFSDPGKKNMPSGGTREPLAYEAPKHSIGPPEYGSCRQSSWNAVGRWPTGYCVRAHLLIRL